MASARREGDCLDCEQQPPKVVPQQLPRRLVNVGHDGPDTGERAVVVVCELERVEETGAERRREFGGGDVLLEISVHSPFFAIRILQCVQKFLRHPGHPFSQLNVDES